MNATPDILTLHSASEAATQALGRALAARLRVGDVLALSGPLGAGKTALARAVIRAATGRPDMVVPSPSFTLLQIYDGGPGGAPLWHVDLYRLSAPEELIELGLEDAWQEAITLVEWPEHAGEALPAGRLDIRLAPAGETARDIAISGGADWARRLDGLAGASS